MPGTDLFNNYVDDTREGLDFRKALENRKSDLDLASQNWITKPGESAAGVMTPAPPPGPAVEDFGAGEPSKKYWNPAGGITDKPTLGPAISTMGGGPLEVVPSHVAAKYTMSGKRIGTVEETSLFDTARKSLESLTGLGEQALGGLVQFTGDTGMASAVAGPAEGADNPDWQAQVAGQGMYQQGEEDVQKTLPDVEPGSLKYHIYGAVQSLALSGTAMTTSVLSGGTMPLIALASFSGAQEYGAQRQGESDVPTALLGAVVNGLAEYWGERLPFEAYMKSPGFFVKVVKGGLFDTVGELGTQTVQSAVQKLTYQPGMTWDDFASTMKDVFIQNMMMATAQGLTVGGVAHAVTKSDFGPTDFKGYVEQNFPGSKVELNDHGANVTLPSGKTVEIHTPTSPQAEQLAKDSGIEQATKDGKTQVAGVYFKIGDTTASENDVIYLTGQGTDLTTLPHEKAHLVMNALSNVLTPEELGSIGLPATGVINSQTEEAVATAFEQYAYKRSPSAENPLSPLDKAFQKVIDFAHEVYSAFGGDTQRTTFEKMRSGEVLTREGAPRLTGETDIQYQRRTEEPTWYKPIKTTKSGRIIGALPSHPDQGAYDSLVRKMFNVASEMHDVNPDQADWYDKGAGDAIRQIYGIHKDEQGNWQGNFDGADKLMKALSLWSVREKVDRNAINARLAMFLDAKGERPAVGNAVNNAQTMADNFIEAMGVREFGIARSGAGPKVDSFYWDLHNGVYGIPDAKNVTIDSHMIEAMGLRTAGGKPPRIAGTQYGWARSVIEDATKKFNEAHGTDYSARQVQALIWEWDRAGQVAIKAEPDTLGKYLPVGVVAGEIVPSTSSDVAPWIHEANPATKKAASDHVAQSVLFDEAGNNKILSLLGVPQGATTPGVGTWKGAVNPNFVSSFMLPEGLDTRLQKLYADIWGYAFTQDSVVRMAPDASLDGKPEALQATLIERENGVPIPEALVPSLIEFVKKKVDTEITLSGGKILALNLRNSETGEPYTGIDDAEYHQKVTEAANEWAKKNKVGRLTAGTFGTDTELRATGQDADGRWDARLYVDRISAEGSPDILAGAHDLRKAALDAWKEFSQEVAPPGAKFQARDTRSSIVDWEGKDITSAVRVAAASYATPIRTLRPEDRVWLLPGGKAIRLETFDLHEHVARRIIDSVTAVGLASAVNEYEPTFAAGTGAIRFHGLQAGQDWGAGWGDRNAFAFETFTRPTADQMELIGRSIGARRQFLVDVSDASGKVITYVSGKGQEGFKTLKKTIKKAYSGAKFQEKSVQTPQGEFPLEHNGWKFEGNWPGTDMYQYSKVLPDSALKATFYVKDPKQIEAVAAKKEEQFSESAKPMFQTKAFKAWFGDSKVVDKGGNPLTLYHATMTPFNFDTFEPATPYHERSHFGTVEQANARIGMSPEAIKSITKSGGVGLRHSNARVIPVTLSIQNPLRLPDMDAWPDPVVWKKRASELPEAIRADVKALARDGDRFNFFDDLVTYLESKGYDGIVYRNEFEAKSKPADSYIAFRPEQVKSVFNANPKMGDPRFQAKPTLYSAAELVVDQKFPATVSINEVMPLLKKYGIKNAEISDLGILGVVGDGKRVSKADLLEHIRASQIQVKEVMKGTGPPPTFDAWSRDNVSPGESPVDARARYDQYRELGDPVTGEGRSDTKFSAYTLPGGENYRELLLTVPLDKNLAVSNGMLRDASGVPMSIDDPRRGYASPHWDEPNVLAHVRFNDRTGPNGERLLHVEEFQSDWSNATRDPISSAPDMPFSGDWKELVAKRMLLYAAQNGYDALTWVTGEQTAARYDLSKQVSSIVYEKIMQGAERKYFIAANQGSRELHNGTYSANELPGVVGKDLAAKIIDAKDVQGEYRGLDLKVGGEWAKKLYDEKFVSIFNKLAKKWGGKAGEIDVAQNHDASNNAPFLSPLQALDIFDRGGEVYGVSSGHEDLVMKREEINSGDYTSFVMGDKQPPTTVHHLALPDQMKQDVATQGLPMYQTRTPGPKGMTVNFADQQVNAMGEELMRSVFEKVARVQTNDESMKLAQEMIGSGKMNLDTFLQHDPNTGWPDTAHSVAADMIAGGVFDYVQSQLEEAKAGRITKEQGLEALFMGMTATASWYGPASEVGRMLQARQMVTTPEQIPVTDFMKEQYDFTRQMADLMDKGLIGQDELIDAATKFYSMEQLSAFRKKVVETKEPSLLNQLFYFSLLSNPVTQAANIVGNLGPVFFAIGEEYLSEKMPFSATPKGGANGMAAGLYHGLLDAIILTGRAAYTGESSFKGGKYDAGTAAKTGIDTIDQARAEIARIKGDPEHPFNNPDNPEYATARRDVMQLHRKAWNPISGDRLNRLTNGNIDANGPLGRALDVLGEMVDGPFKGLAAGDEFFKTIAYRMSIWGRAYQMGASQGLEGDDFNTFVAKFVDNPPDADHAIAKEFAAKQTFNNEPGKIGQAMMNMTREYPALRLVVPFVTVISNIGRYNLERMPIANLLLRSVRNDIAAGGKARDMALAKTAMGAAVAGAFSVLAGVGMMTGGGPSDPDKRKLWIQQGWQEYSFKIGKDYYSYKRLEPFATPLGVVADIIEMARFSPDFDLDEGALVAALAFIRNFTSKTYMSGVSQLLDTVVSGGEDTLLSSAGRWQKTMARLAVPAGVSQLAHVTDPVKRDVRDWKDAIMERIPGLSSSMPPIRNLKGEPVTVGMYENVPGKLFGMVNPVYYTSEKDDPVSQEILANRMKITMPSRSIGGGQDPEKPQLEEGDPAIPLTPEQYDWLVRMAGNELKDPDTGLGAWDTLRRMVTNRIPVDTVDGKDIFYRDFSKGPQGGRAYVFQKVLGSYRTAARRMLEGGEVFPELGDKYAQKKERRGRQLMPRVGQ